MYGVFSGEQHIIGNDLAKLEPLKYLEIHSILRCQKNL